MKDLKDDSITKNIVSNSYMLITKPGFNDIIIRKIFQQKKRRAVMNYFFFCSLLIIVAVLLVLLSIPAELPVTGNATTILEKFGVNVLGRISETKSWFMDNLVFFIPLLLLFFLKQIIDQGFKRSAHWR